MARITFAEAKNLTHDVVTSKGPTDPKVASYLNLVVAKFLRSPNKYKGAQFTALIQADDLGTLATPAEVETIDALAVATGEVVTLQSELYQFQDDAHGFLPPTQDPRGVAPYTAVKQGDNFPTQFDPSTPQPIAFAATFGNIEVRVTYVATDSPWVQTTTQTTPFTLTKDVQKIVNIVKPATSGLIVTAQISGKSIGIIPPSCTVPSFTRYRVMGDNPETRAFYAYCTRAYIPLVNDDDPLHTGNINALSYGMQAVNYERKNDLERASAYWNMAYQALDEELANSRSSTAQLQLNLQMKAFAPTIRNLI